MYLTAVINIGEFDYIPCKQNITNPNKFIKKFIQNANPGLYALNFTNVNYVCLKTKSKKYIFDSLNQKFSEQIEPIELISDLLFIINNSNSKKKLLSMLIIILCKSFKWNNEEITKLLSYAEELENSKQLKETIISEIYNNNKTLYNFITGGSVLHSPINSHDFSKSSEKKDLSTIIDKEDISKLSKEELLQYINKEDLIKFIKKEYLPKKSINKDTISKEHEKYDTKQLTDFTSKLKHQVEIPKIDHQYSESSESKFNDSSKSYQDKSTKKGSIDTHSKQIPIIQHSKFLTTGRSPESIKKKLTIEEMQKYYNILPINNFPNIDQMKKYANMIPKDIPKDTILGMILSILFSLIQGIPFVGYPFIIYETIQNIINGNYTSLLIKPLKFIPGLGFIISVFSTFGKIGRFFNLVFS
jgi:hypothetical protein